MTSTKVTELLSSTQLSLQDFSTAVVGNENIKVTLENMADFLIGTSSLVAAPRYAPIRTYGVTYQNLTGGLMFVNVNLQRVANGTFYSWVGALPFTAPVNALETVTSARTGMFEALFFIVPVGSYYSVLGDTAHTPISWFETILTVG